MEMRLSRLVDVTFFFTKKKKVTKEKTRDLVTRYNVSAAAIPVLSARYTKSHFFDGVGSVLGSFSSCQQKSLGQKRAEQWWACAAAGALQCLAEAMAMSKRSSGKILPPVVMTDLPCEGIERKEASWLT